MLGPGAQPPIRQTQPTPPPLALSVAVRGVSDGLLPCYSPAPITCPQTHFQGTLCPSRAWRLQETRSIEGGRKGSGCLSRGLPLAPARPVPSLFMTNNDGYSCQALRLPGQTGAGGSLPHLPHPRKGGSSPCPPFPLHLLTPHSSDINEPSLGARQCAKAEDTVDGTVSLTQTCCCREKCRRGMRTGSCLRQWSGESPLRRGCGGPKPSSPHSVSILGGQGAQHAFPCLPSSSWRSLPRRLSWKVEDGFGGLGFSSCLRPSSLACERQE